MLTTSRSRIYPKRIVRRIYKSRNWDPANELKGANLYLNEEIKLAQKTVEMINRHPEIKILTITVNKKNVKDHIRRDPNKLYNYMISLCILEHIINQPRIIFIPDPRSIKVESGNSLVDYLQIKLWFEHNSQTQIIHQGIESKNCLNLQFIDFISHIVWCAHEDRKLEPYSILQNHITAKHLFFDN